MKNNVAIIPARGGSKGVHKKNIKIFNGKPLIAWSIEHAINAELVNSVWVTSDDDEILDISMKYGAKVIKRPSEISTDTDSSESAWIHAYDYIHSQQEKIDAIIGMQATSPIRDSQDLDLAIKKFYNDNLDSLFSSFKIEDYFIWEESTDKTLCSKTYDWKNRKLRQLIQPQFLETGSFYIFKPEILKINNNRLGGKIGTYEMKKHQSFQIDSLDDFRLCEIIMKGFDGT